MSNTTPTAPQAAAGVAAAELDAYLGDARSWEADRQAQLERSERRAWWVAAGACLLAAGAMAAAILQAMRPIAAPPIVALDKTSGNVEVIRAGDDLAKGYSELVEKYWAKKYVIARETYLYTLLQHDYDTVLALSSDDVGRPYARSFDGESAKDRRLGSSVEERVKVISVVLPPGEAGKAVVRFDKVVRRTQSEVPEPAQTFVATMAYTFQPSTRGRERDLIENPLGFKVTSYRVDAEIVR